MFCTKCGAKIEDGGMFCPECGAKLEIEESVTAAETENVSAVKETTEPANNESAAETPAAETSVTETAAPAAESTATAEESDAKPEKEKKSFKDFIKNHKALVAVLAVVIVLAVVVIAFFPKVANGAVKLFTSPAGYYRYVEKKSLKETVVDCTDSYELLRNNVIEATNRSLTGSLGIVMGEEGTELLEKLEKTVDIDLAWIKKLNLSGSFNVKDQNAGASFDAKLNGKDIISAQIAADLKEGNFYITVPELNSKSLYGELSEDSLRSLLGGKTAYVAGYGPSYDDEDSDKSEISASDLTKKLEKTLPKKAQLLKLANDYLTVALKQFDSVKQTNSKKLKVEKIEQKVTVLTVKVDEKTVENLIVKLGTKLLNDKDIRKIFVENVSAYMDATASKEDAEEIYDYFLDALEDIIDDADDFAEEFCEDNEVNYVLYVDGNGNVVGRELTVLDSDEDGIIIGYKSSEKGGKYGFELSAAEIINGKEQKNPEFEITSSGKVSGEKYTGDVKFNVPGEGFIFKFAISDMDFSKISKGSIKGNAVFTIDSNLLSYFDYTLRSISQTLFKGDDVTLDINFDITKNSAKSDVTVFMGKSDKLFTLEMSSKTGKGTKTAIPSAKKCVDIDDEDEMEDWISELNLDGISKKLDKADASDDVLDLIDDLQKQLDRMY